MIKRIVRLSFEPILVGQFIEQFDEVKSKIRAFEGCQSMALLRDTHHPYVFFTISVWDSEEALNRYRESDLFGSIWPTTKALFNGPPKAWSLQLIDGQTTTDRDQ